LPEARGDGGGQHDMATRNMLFLNEYG